MFKVKESLKTNGLCLQGNTPDILTYLEREQERCGKMPVLQYLQQRMLERAVSRQAGTVDPRSKG